MKNSFKEADKNLALLKSHPYPGRGIIQGLNNTGKFLVQVYFLMGRSENSRNRVFTIGPEEGELRTEPADRSKVTDPSLIIYTAMMEEGVAFAVSNGHQTQDALNAAGAGYGLFDGEFFPNKWQYEPDKPNFTPRITGILWERGHDEIIADFSILKRSPFNESCIQQNFRYPALTEGIGYCITTYDDDGDPLPSFTGEPYTLPLRGDIQEVAESIWSSLNEDNRISLAVKFIDILSWESKTHIINKYVQVDAD